MLNLGPVDRQMIEKAKDASHFERILARWRGVEFDGGRMRDLAGDVEGSRERKEMEKRERELSRWHHEVEERKKKTTGGSSITSKEPTAGGKKGKKNEDDEDL